MVTTDMNINPKVYSIDGTGQTKSLVKQWGSDPEESAIVQIRNVATLPFVTPHLATMPDCHMGYGATIGSIIPTDGVVIPMAVGMDIGCGMLAARTSLSLKDTTKQLNEELYNAISVMIPHGRTHNGDPKKDKGAWRVEEKIPDRIWEAWPDLSNELMKITTNMSKSLRDHIEGANHFQHLGTLGTGNHFIELASDEFEDIWIIIHSGSRGVGGAIANSFTKLAKNYCKAWHISLIDPNLAYFPIIVDEFRQYIDSALWAQKFADISRRLMLSFVKDAIEIVFDDSIALDDEYSCHHNFVAWEHHFGKNLLITRKGACRAQEGDKLVIPGSMGANVPTYLCHGKGEKQSFNSCAHGAGRIMSRGNAKKTISIEDHKEATRGVICRKDQGILDESPAAYKDIDEVMDAQSDLVGIDYTLNKFLCVKG